MPVNPYENLTAVACLRTEAARKGRYGQFAGSVDTSQAKCKLGLKLSLSTVCTSQSRVIIRLVKIIVKCSKYVFIAQPQAKPCRRHGDGGRWPLSVCLSVGNIQCRMDIET